MKKILLILSLFISSFVSAQRFQHVHTWGWDIYRFRIDTLAGIPADTFPVPSAYINYPFIAAKGSTIYVWNKTTHVWAAISGSGGSTNTSIGTGYKVAVDGTNNVKSLIAANGLVADSAVSGEVRFQLGDILANRGAQFSGLRYINGRQTHPTQGFPLISFDSLVFQVTNLGGTTFVSRQGYTDISANVANRAYTRYTASPGVIYSFALDSFVVGAGGVVTASPTYLSLHPDQVYLASTTGKMIFGAGTYADQYATDSLIWRMEDRSSFFLLNPGVAEIYAGTAEIELELDDINLDADSIRTIRAANVKPITDSAGWYMKIRNRATGTEADAYWPAGGGATPTWQQTLTAGSTLTGNNTIVNGANTLTVTNNTLANSQGVILSSSSTAAIANQTMLLSQLSGTNANSAVESFGVRGSVSRDGTGSINTGVFGSASQGATSNTAVYGQATDGVTAIGGKFEASGATNNYAVQLVDGTEGAGKVLTSDATGKASWATPSAGSASLTSTRVGYGDGSNLLTGEAAFNYDATNNALNVGSILINGTSWINFYGDNNWYIRQAVQFNETIKNESNNWQITAASGNFFNNGSTAFGATSAVASAKVEIVSTTQGFLPPRMTATQASAISSPAEGLLVYVTDTNGTFTSKGWWGWSGAAWEKLNN